MQSNRILFFLACLFIIRLFASCNRANDCVSVVSVDPLVKVFRESSFPANPVAGAEVARGEYATLQFVVKSSFAIKSLSVNIKPAKYGKSELKDAAYFFVGYVKVDRPMYLPPEDILYSNTGYFPDPLLPEKEMDTEAGQSQPIWISIKIPGDIEPGKYQGKVVFKGKINGRSVSIPRDYVIHVYSVTVNRPRLWTTNWHNEHNFSFLNGGKNVERYSDEYWRFLKMTADKMAEYCQNVAIIYPLDNIKFSKKGDEWQFDYTNFDKTVQVFIDAGVIGRIEGGHIAWGNRTLTALVMAVPAADSAGVAIPRYNAELTNSEVRHFYKSFFPPFMSHLKDKGWDKIYMQHISDEPGKKVAKSYVEIGRFLKSIVPDIRILDAADNIELVGAIDTWVPVLYNFDKYLDFYKDRAKEGNEIWTYTCCGPDGRYPNRFIEYPLLKPRYLHWLNFKYNATGFLHWGFNQWEAGANGATDIFDDPGGFITPTIFPAGDKCVVYPYKGEIISSIRFDAVRDGLYDYELLKMYEEKDSAAARKLCDSRIVDFKHYDMSISSFRATRKQLLEKLSE